MDVFHYVAHQLRRVSLFQTACVRNDGGMGAVYNDFDCDPRSLLSMEDEDFHYSQSIADEPCEEAATANDVPEDAVAFAILEADATDHNLYELLSVEHVLADFTSQLNDVHYMVKVLEIATSAWEEIWPHLSDKAFEVFGMRYRLDWRGTDSMYDSWLIKEGLERKAFPMNVFQHRFPDWKSRVFSVGEPDEEDRKLFAVNVVPTYTIEISSDEESQADSKSGIQLYMSKLIGNAEVITISDSD